jgi:hypothetical protein
MKDATSLVRAWLYLRDSTLPKRFALLVGLVLLASTGSPGQSSSSQSSPGQMTVYFPSATRPQTRTMTVDDVIKLSKAGLSDDVIIQQIRKEGQRFDLSTDQLVQLKSASVSERVIQAMIQPTEDTAPSPAEKAAAPALAPQQAERRNLQDSSASGFSMSGSGQEQSLSLQDPAQLVGKQVNVQRLPLCQPGTYTVDLSHAGKQATVVSVKSNNRIPALPPRAVSRLAPEMRAMIEDQQKAATLLLQFEDGTKLDSCAPLGPQMLVSYLELVPGQTLVPVSHPAPTIAAASTATNPQECPVAVTKVTSSEGGFGHAFADSLTTSEFERQLDKTTHEGRDKHYLDMRMRNNSLKRIRAIESVALYSNVMGDESIQDALVSQNTKPIKPGEEYKSYFMDRSLQSANGKGEVTVYIQRIRFEDGTFWQDNGSHSCALISQIKR